MGYSISVSVRSQRHKEEMYAFLRHHYRTWAAINGSSEQDFQGPYLDEELDAPGKCCIGFNYHPVMGPEREYHFALVRWIALHVGKRRSRFRGEGLHLDTSVAYIVFDGIEAVPVLVQAEWPKVTPELQGYVYDSLGMKVDDSVAKELAWHCLPVGAFEKVSATHHNRPPEVIQEALIQEGLPGALAVLQTIRSQIARLSVLWKTKRGKGQI